MKAAKSVDAYLRLFPDDQRCALEKIRNAIKEAAPMAEETISYGMPAYKQNGVLAYFGGFRNHCSFFPAGSAVIKEFHDELKPYKTSKGTVQFHSNAPIPVSLIKKMVREKVRQNLNKQTARTASKGSAKRRSE